MKPSKPRYEVTWDPSTVLDYISTLYPNDNLTLEDLTLKLVSLLALVTGHRMQTFSLVELNNIKILPDRIEIKITDRIKTSGLNKTQPVLILPVFTENPRICVALALKTYISATQNIRGDIKKLFISTRKPYKAITTQTLSRWVKTILSRSGVDTDTFKAHSTRHASTSAAYRKGLDLEVIRKTVGWSKKSEVFAKFYNRPVIDACSFARSVLSG